MGDIKSIARSWQCFGALPAEVQALARKNYALLGVHWFWIGTHSDYDKLAG